MAALDLDVSLHTARLRLRALRADDAHALLTIFADPHVMRYWSTRPWAGIEQAHEFIERSAAALGAGDALRLGVEREGLLRERWIVDGEVSNSAFYGLLAREWRARKRQ